MIAVIQEELEFPFNAQVIGETVQVVGMDYSEGDSLGLDLVIEQNGKRYPIDARSFDLVPPFPDGAFVSGGLPGTETNPVNLHKA